MSMKVPEIYEVKKIKGKIFMFLKKKEEIQKEVKVRKDSGKVTKGQKQLRNAKIPTKSQKNFERTKNSENVFIK